MHRVQSSFVWFTVVQRGKGKNSFFQSGGKQRNKRHLHFLQFLAHIDDTCADQIQVLELRQNERNVFLFGSSVVFAGFCMGGCTGVWLLINA